MNRHIFSFPEKFSPFSLKASENLHCHFAEKTYVGVEKAGNK